MKKLYVFLFVILLTLTATKLAQRDWSKVEITAEKVTDNIYMLKGAGGNIGVSVGEDGVLMIDAQYAQISDKIKTAIKELGGDHPNFILNTHWHGDHTNGNENFGGEGTIIAHKNVRTRLATVSYTAFSPQGVGPSPKVALPIITFDQSLSLHFNNEEIKAMHYPNGHTDGDAVIYFKKSNVVHTGDNYFAGMFPFVDLKNGGNIENLPGIIGRIIDELPADVKIIPGHGPLSTLDDLKTYRKMLIETTQVVRQQMDAGKTLDEIKAAGLPGWEEWGNGFIKTPFWIELIHTSLSQNISKK